MKTTINKILTPNPKIWFEYLRFTAEPLVGFLAKTFINPNHVTIFRFIMNIFTCYILIYGNYLLILPIFLLFFNLWLDLVDGMLARAKNMYSVPGKIMEYLTDNVIFLLDGLYGIALAIRLQSFLFFIVVISMIALNANNRHYLPSNNNHIDIRTKASRLRMVFEYLTTQHTILGLTCLLYFAFGNIVFVYLIYFYFLVYYGLFVKRITKVIYTNITEGRDTYERKMGIYIFKK